MFLAENEVLMGKDTDQNINARSLTLLCGGVGIVWSTTTQTQVSYATAVTFFSVKCFNPLKLYPLVRKHLQKVNQIAVTTLSLTPSLHRC